MDTKLFTCKECGQKHHEDGFQCKPEYRDCTCSTEKIGSEYKKILCNYHANKAVEEEFICDACKHFISRHDDNGNCYSCIDDKCEITN